jgi:hypothetical protein
MNAPLAVWPAAWLLAMLTALLLHASARAANPTSLIMNASAATSAAATAAANTAPAAPPEVQAALPKAQLIGKGNLRFFGLLVYEARLWAAPGFKPAAYDTQPFALELEYARKLDGAAIAERSVAEMRRVGSFSDEQARAWLALMTQAFPNVVAKDRLIGLHDGKGGVRFFHNAKPTASTTDREYAKLFFGIWLHPETSAPALRQALIGATD